MSVAGVARLVALFVLATLAAPDHYAEPGLLAEAGAAQNPRQSGSQDDEGCTISVVGLEFGDYDGHSPQPLDSYTTLIVNCRPIPGEGSVPMAQVQINRGSSPSFQRREMVGPGGVIYYNVYLDATRQTIWGDGSGGTDYVRIDRPRPNQDLVFPVYGRVDALQAVAAGRYQDMLTVSVIF